MPRARAKPAPEPTPSGTARQITQADLARARELQDQARAVEYALAPLKRSILADLDAGVAVEPGSLRADVEIRSQQRLSREVLTRLLGVAEFEAVMAQIEPSLSRSLKVVLWV